MKPRRLRKGQTIGVIAQSEPITEDCMEDIRKAVKLVEEIGLDVKFAEHVCNNPTGYGETAKNKADDINKMFADKDIARYFLCYAVDIIVIQCLII